MRDLAHLPSPEHLLSVLAQGDAVDPCAVDDVEGRLLVDRVEDHGRAGGNDPLEVVPGGEARPPSLREVRDLGLHPELLHLRPGLFLPDGVGELGQQPQFHVVRPPDAVQLLRRLVAQHGVPLTAELPGHGRVVHPLAAHQGLALWRDVAPLVPLPALHDHTHVRIHAEVVVEALEELAAELLPEDLVGLHALQSPAGGRVVLEALAAPHPARGVGFPPVQADAGTAARRDGDVAARHAQRGGGGPEELRREQGDAGSGQHEARQRSRLGIGGGGAGRLD
mmetsp:Transcript_102527/g.289932  ORF Transcript_102527/g.289932 Transcript_102527/m.289932 type:complete len:280 (+) Transcript_102527:428-1267(+)